jgi:tripartite-type tricarboxylate transporter receptor subunit TctC
MLLGIRTALAAFVILSTTAFAQADKPVVEVYTSLPVAGSGGQIGVGIVRALNAVQDKREYKLGVIQGAAGDSSAIRALADAKNGKTVVLFNGISMFTFNRITNPDSGFDRENGFVISNSIGKNHYEIMVAPDSDIKTLDELVEKLRTKKESFVGQTLSGPGATMFNDFFLKKYNLDKVKTIQYKTPQEIILAVQNKEVDYTLFTISDMQQLRALAVSSEKRLETFPNAPTAKELNFPEFQASSILIFAVPKDNSKFVTTFEEDMRLACASKEFEPVAKIRQPYLSYCINPTETKRIVDNENALINRAYKK